MMSLIMYTNCFASRFSFINETWILAVCPREREREIWIKDHTLSKCFGWISFRSVYVNLTPNLIFKYFVKATNSFWDYSNDWINNDLALFFSIFVFHLRRPPSLFRSGLKSNIYFLWTHKILALTIWLLEIFVRNIKL